MEENIREIDSKYSWMKTNFKVSSLFGSVKQELKRGLKNLDKNHFKNHAKAIEAEELFDELWGDAEKIISLENQKQAAKDDYYKYKASDGYEQFKTELYLSAGMRAEDANVGGIGMAIPNADEKISKFVSLLKEQGYDGIIIKNTEYDKGTLGNGKSNNQYVAFYSNQIKLTTNLNPTQNEDIRYSLTDSKGRKLTEAQREFFKDSKARDEQGRLLEVYHGTGAGFNVFDRTIARSYSAVNYYLPAFYFSADKRQARDYGSRVIVPLI